MVMGFWEREWRFLPRHFEFGCLVMTCMLCVSCLGVLPEANSHWTLGLGYFAFSVDPRHLL